MSELKIHWKVERRNVVDLKLWDKNPRKISKEQFEKLKSRIIARGFHDVLKVDIDNTVLSGNQRKQALVDLGITEVNVMVPERKLTDEERDQVALESNIEDGVYDYHLLGDRFDPDLLIDIGLTPNQIERAFDLKTSDDEFDADEEVKNIDTPVTVLGDVWQLGDHRIMCGDSTSVDDVQKLMQGEEADMMFTDPPYGISYQLGAAKGQKSKHDKIANDDLKSSELVEFLTDALIAGSGVCKKNACYYIWHATSTSEQFREAMKNAMIDIHQTIIWVKNSFTLTRADFQHTLEPCFYGWRKGSTHWTNKEIANIKDIWTTLDFDSLGDMLDVWFQKRDKAGDYVHPTQKPVQLAERALRKSCQPGGIVLDLFVTGKQIGRAHV